MQNGRNDGKPKEQFWDHSRWTGHDQLDEEVRGRLTQVKSREILRRHHAPRSDPDFSGLMDIRALAHASRAELQIDGNAITLSGLPSAASVPPVLPVQQIGWSTESKVGIVALMVAAAGLLALIAVMLLRADETPAATDPGGTPQLAALMLAAVDPPSPGQPAPVVLDPTDTVAPAGQPTVTRQAPGEAPAPTTKPRARSKRERQRKLWRSTELDALLGGALESRARTRPERQRAGDRDDDRPATLSRAQVRSGLDKVGPRVKRKCGETRDGVVTVEVVIGKNGRVARSRPVGAQTGTDVGRCAARAARKARFPKFSGAPITVKYPFRL